MLSVRQGLERESDRKICRAELSKKCMFSAERKGPWAGTGREHDSSDFRKAHIALQRFKLCTTDSRRASFKYVLGRTFELRLYCTN